jgi:threonine/homoserine/homoserine lactone efflux protein
MDVSHVSLVVFAIVAAITPGPNNVLVAANAAANGMRATVPHMLGIGVGFALMIVLVGLGLGGVMTANPTVATALRWGSMAWLVWLAVQIATAPPPGSAEGGMRFGFVAAMLFQWINPKAWLLALTIAAAWVRPTAPIGPQLALIGAVFLLVTPPCCLPWALLGRGAVRVLGHGPALRAFNIAMAIALVASMLPLVLEG